MKKVFQPVPGFLFLVFIFASMDHAWHQEVRFAAERIRPFIYRTPLEYSAVLSQETGAEVYLKLELYQHTGSFKLRGAANRLLSLPAEKRKHGVITASTGNHGVAVLHMAQQLEIPVQIYLPEDADAGKVSRLQRLGARITQVGNDGLIAEMEARQRAEAEGIPFISPYNDPAVIAGQGTATLEILEDLPDAEAIFIPVGGGGLISGAGAAISGNPGRVELIGCQPENSAVMHASIRQGKILDMPSLPTLSDGTAGGLEAGSITFPLCQQWVDRFIEVDENAIRTAMRSFLQYHQILAEGAAGLSLAALRQRPDAFQGKKLVLFLCGRNLSMDVLKQVISG